MAFIDHTTPAVYIPSKNSPTNQLTSHIDAVNPPKTNDIKNPTHVDVHKVQLIKSPKNLDLEIIHCLVDSNIEPQTSIDVIPYAANDHKTK
jgi:hypothetical protein